MCTSKMITGLTKYDGEPYLTLFDYYARPRIIPSWKLAMHFLDLINWLNMKNSVVRNEANILRAVVFTLLPANATVTIAMLFGPFEHIM